jgi:hypothetical protein
VVADPAATIGKLISGFGKLGIALDGDPEAAASSVESQRHAATQPVRMTGPQKRLLTVVTRLPSVSASFQPPSLPRETWWTQQALTRRPPRLSFARVIQKLYVFR